MIAKNNQEALRNISRNTLLAYLEKQSPERHDGNPVDWIVDAIKSHGPNIGGIDAVLQLVNEHPEAKHHRLFVQALERIRSSTTIR